MDHCSCSSGKVYEECCGQFISGKKKPKTAEQLMRARYTAHSRTEVDFIINTLHPSRRKDESPKEIRQWCESTKWKTFEIVLLEEGGEDDNEGVVEFKATYTSKDIKGEMHDGVHHEIAEFKKVKGEWFFWDGRPPRQEPFRHEEKQTGLNEPCPCGSGKKFKRCCGR